jgi:hypothetical protein
MSYFFTETRLLDAESLGRDNQQQVELTDQGSTGRILLGDELSKVFKGTVVTLVVNDIVFGQGSLSHACRCYWRWIGCVSV